jgi:glycosyltransferase involved in cell wall biosynthesis
MPIWNGDQFLRESLDSILAQAFGDFELIITDNASTDRTAEICLEYQGLDRRIKYYRNGRNIGAGPNFNLGFQLSEGEYFKWCAHDDIISANYMLECVRTLDRRGDVVTALGHLQGINARGELTPYFERQSADTIRDVFDEKLGPSRRFAAMVRSNGLDSAIFGLHRRSALRKTSLHRPYYGSDCALLAEMALLGPFARVENAVLYSRDHPDRSVNQPSELRITWQNAAARNSNSHEVASRVKHLLEILCRRTALAPLYSTIPSLLIWMLHPLVLGRLALEGVGAISPSLRRVLRQCGCAALRSFRTRYSEARVLVMGHPRDGSGATTRARGP